MKKYSRFERKKMIPVILGALIGGIIGFLMYKYVGCQTGTCPLMQKSWLSIVYYGIIGALVFGSVFS